MLTLLIASSFFLSSITADNGEMTAAPPAFDGNASDRVEILDGQPLFSGRLLLNCNLAFGTGVYREFDWSSQVANHSAIDSGGAMLCYIGAQVGARHGCVRFLSDLVFIEPASTYQIMKYREFSHLGLALGCVLAERRWISFTPRVGYGWFKEMMWAFRLGGPDLGSASIAYQGAQFGVDLKCILSADVRIRSLNSIYLASPSCYKAAIAFERSFPFIGSAGKYHVGIGFDAFFYNNKVRYLMASLQGGF